MIILIDENVKRIDKKVMRVSVCCVEVDNENILDDIRGYVNSIKDDRIRFSQLIKFILVQCRKHSVNPLLNTFQKLI